MSLFLFLKIFCAFRYFDLDFEYKKKNGIYETECRTSLLNQQSLPK
jgi:hypothetical protein